VARILNSYSFVRVLIVINLTTEAEMGVVEWKGRGSHLLIGFSPTQAVDIVSKFGPRQAFRTLSGSKGGCAFAHPCSLPLVANKGAGR
jgi:hypothetical protein